MLIIGAGGLAMDLLHVISESVGKSQIIFYDDVSDLHNISLRHNHRIIRTPPEAAGYFDEYDRRFVLGIGKPALRNMMTGKFENLGGQLTTLISQLAVIGNFNTLIEDGCTVLPHAVISNASRIGRGSLVHHRAVISHGCTLGHFCEISPGATILGHVSIGDLTQVGANATVLPGVNIGKGCLIGAGSVVNRDIPDGKIVTGIPGRVVGIQHSLWDEIKSVTT